MDPAARCRRLVLAGLLVVGSVLLFTRVWDWWLEHEDLSRLDTPLMRWLRSTGTRWSRPSWS